MRQLPPAALPVQDPELRLKHLPEPWGRAEVPLRGTARQQHAVQWLFALHPCTLLAHSVIVLFSFAAVSYFVVGLTTKTHILFLFV